MDLRAVIFVPALAISAICVFVFLIFAAHYYLTILESTAAGAKEVTWFSEPIIDNFWKPFYLAWLLCLWLGPAYVIGRVLAASTGASWLGLAVPVFVAWLLYPVSQLSSLCALSVWIPLHPQVPARLAQKPGVVVGFFLLSLPLFALAGVAFRWAFLTRDEWHLLLLGVPLLVLAGFLYARLLGRLAFALMFTRDLLKRKKKKKRKEEQGEEEGETEVAKPAVVQPSEMAPISTPDGELTGYNVLIADDPPKPKRRVKAEIAEEDDEADEAAARSALKPPPVPKAEARPATEASRARTDDDDDATPYGMNEPEVEPEDRIPKEVVQPRTDEMALLDRRDAPKLPKRVWSGELFAFLAQPGTVSAMGILTLIGTLAGAAVRFARMVNPVASAV